jgi:hypothetical protein
MRSPLPKDWRVRYVAAVCARCLGPVEDQGANRGQLPDYLAKRNQGTLADFWCCHLCGATGRDQFGKAWPLLLSGSCQQQREWAKKKGALRTRAEFDTAFAADPLSVLGWLFLVVDVAKDHAHHIGAIGNVDDTTGELVTRGPRGGFLTAEGNAADPRQPASRNGDGAYQGRERGHPGDKTTYEFVDLGAFP